MQNGRRFIYLLFIVFIGCA